MSDQAFSLQRFFQQVGMSFDTRRLGAAPDAIAPDGSEVRVLCATARGSMAVFTLPPGAVSKPVVHRTVEEVWYIVSGIGRMWRQFADQQQVTDLTPGVSFSIPLGTRFQFRCDGPEPLSAVGVTMPPWPGQDEAEIVSGLWS
jgi:mannose-6-phosphate isomerase-like protein (cupin superfamily)